MVMEGHLFRSAAFCFLVLILLHHTCLANNPCTSSCGSIHNISYPFRLPADPITCGLIKYELVCLNNFTVLYMGSVKYYVRAINYNNFTIRLLKADQQLDNCSSFPQSYSLYDDLYNYGYPGNVLWPLIFVNCPEAFNSASSLFSYVETSPCIKAEYNSTSNSSSSHLKGYSYVLFGNNIYVEDLMDSCRIESITATSLFPIDNYKDVYKSLEYGFEVSWPLASCENYKENPCNLDNLSIENYCGLQGNPNPNPIKYHVIRFLVRIIDCIDNFVRYLLRIQWPPTFLYPGYSSCKHENSLHNCVDLLLLYVLSFFVLLHAILLALGAPCIIIFLIYIWRRRHLSMYQSIEEFLQSDNNLMPIRYSYSDIKKITKGFKDKLGEGGFGSVYKGTLRSGRFAAIKILDKSKTNGQDFISEVATIGRIHHVNVVSLIGFCSEGSKHALVYEFMPNGSLDKHIFSEKNDIQVSDEQMFQISLGIARGIEYLHQGCDMQILHFDIKPHNILLDEKFIPKISDFGLAKSFSTCNSIVSLTAARGTIGYMAPELYYKNIGRISYKADVYSFGMLLMEMAGRRKNLNPFVEKLSQIYFPSWAYNQLNEGKDISLNDATEEEKEKTRKMFIVALWCIQLKPTDRPPMHKVVQMLEGEEHLEMPPKPFTSPNEMVQEDARINMRPTWVVDQPNDDEDCISLLRNAN